MAVACAATRSLAAAALIALTAGGCEGVHLYDEGKAKTAASVKEAYAKVDLVKVFAARRQNLERLRDAEIDAARQNQQLVADELLLQFARSSQLKAQLSLGPRPFPAPVPPTGGDTAEARARLLTTETYLRRRLAELGIDSQRSLSDIAAAYDRSTREALLVTVEEKRAEVIAGGWPDPPGCAQHPLPTTVPERILGSLQPDRRLTMPFVYSAYRTACSASDDSYGGVATGGVFGRARAKWKNAVAKLEELAAQRLSTNEAVTRAEREYDAAVAAAGSGSDARKAAIIKVIGTLRDGLTGLTKGADLVGVELGAAEQRIASIDRLLLSGAAGAVDQERVQNDAALRRATLVAAATPGLAADAGALADGLAAPPTSALYIAKQHAVLTRNYAAARFALAVEREALLRRMLSAIAMEASSLNAAVLAAQGVPEAASPDALLGTRATPAAKVAALRATAEMTRSISSARAEQDEIGYRLNHLLYLEGVAADEFAVGAWDALIAQPIEVLNTYHAAGIRPEVIADLIAKAGGVFALGFIARGTN